MDRRNRPGLAFSLSFLDVMSVGLGSVILIFLIINHASEVVSRQATAEQAETLEQVRAEFNAREATAEALARALEAREAQLRGARARLDELRRLLAIEQDAESGATSEEAVAALRDEVRELERRVAGLRRETMDRRSADSVFSRAGDGRRQYLTGLRVDGERVLILLDISASMLGETIVDAIRLRNMDRAAWNAADKWQRALESAEWMAAQLAPGAQYQIYTFSEQARSVLEDRTGQWLDVDDRATLLDALGRMREASSGRRHQPVQRVPRGRGAVAGAGRNIPGHRSHPHCRRRRCRARTGQPRAAHAAVPGSGLATARRRGGQRHSAAHGRRPDGRQSVLATGQHHRRRDAGAGSRLAMRSRP